MKTDISVITPSIRPQFLDITQRCLQAQTDRDFEWLVDIDFTDRGFLLPKAMNRLLKRAQGKIIVVLQDCISVPPNFIEYVRNTWDPVVFKTFPISKDKKFDWRKDGEPRFVEPQEWEMDLAVAPRKAFFDVGGFDESFCQGWSWENVELAYRASAAGFRFFCDNRIFGEAVDHDALVDHPFRNEMKSNALKAEITRKSAEMGNYKFDYLLDIDL